MTLTRYNVVATHDPPDVVPLRTDVAGFAGGLARGPAGCPVRVGDRAEVSRLFGPPDSAGFLARAIEGYFVNGGEVAYVYRLLGPDATVASGTLELGVESPVYVLASSPGAWAERLVVRVTRRSVGPAWAIEVQPAGGPAERGFGSSLAAAAEGLALIRLDIPKVSLATAVRTATVELEGGSDGARPGAAEYRAALRSLGEEPEVALLALPDLWSHLGDDGYGVAAEAAYAAHSTLDRMVVLDLPESANASTAAAVEEAEKLEKVLPAPAARAAAVYYPWISVLPADAELITLPPSGHVTGLISRLDRERGPARTPANATLTDAVNLAGTADDATLVKRRINPIRSAPRRGLQVWGGRTFDPTTNGRFVAHRRLTHRLVRAARQAAEPLVFEPVAPPLLRALTRAITTVLLTAFRARVLAGRSAAEAFSVQATAEDSTVVCDVSFAPADPMEFITIRLTLGPEGRLEVIEQ
jgi:hypothetical protein